MLCADLTAIHAYKDSIRWNIVTSLSLPILIGILIGFCLLDYVKDKENVVKQCIGFALLFLSTIVFISKIIINQKHKDNRIIYYEAEDDILPITFDNRARLKYWFHSNKLLILSISIGLISGILSVISNVAGPVIAIYLIQLKLSKRELNGTRAWIFIIANSMKLPIQILLGNLRFNDITSLILLCLVAICSTLVCESFIISLVDQIYFDKIVWLLVFIGALKLLLY